MNRGPDGKPFVPPRASRFATAAGVRMHVGHAVHHPQGECPDGFNARLPVFLEGH